MRAVLLLLVALAASTEAFNGFSGARALSRSSPVMGAKKAVKKAPVKKAPVKKAPVKKPVAKKPAKAKAPADYGGLIGGECAVRIMFAAFGVHSSPLGGGRHAHPLPLLSSAAAQVSSRAEASTTRSTTPRARTSTASAAWSLRTVGTCPCFAWGCYDRIVVWAHELIAPFPSSASACSPSPASSSRRCTAGPTPRATLTAPTPSLRWALCQSSAFSRSSWSSASSSLRPATSTSPAPLVISAGIPSASPRTA